MVFAPFDYSKQFSQRFTVNASLTLRPTFPKRLVTGYNQFNLTVGYQDLII